MQDKPNLTIGVLSITAVVLLVGVFITLGQQNSAMAIGQLDRGGDYILVTGQFTDTTELVYVTDAAAQRMNIYSDDQSTRQFDLWDTIDLRRVFAAAGP
jgi:hypothetical protein